MKKHKIASYFLIFALFALTVSCNKDKNSDPNNDKANNGQNGGGGSSNLGAPFTYDFTITGGKYDGQHFSGNCDNKSNLSTTNALLDGTDPETFVVSMNDIDANKIKIVERFILHKDGTFAKLDAKDKKSEIRISFTDGSTYIKDYNSISGTFNLSNLQREAGNFFISFNAQFDGTFNNDIDGDVHIKGTIITYLPAK